MAIIALYIFSLLIGLGIFMTESLQENERLSGMAKKARQQ